MSLPVPVERHTDDEHWYLYPPTGEVFPSVTTIISGTQNKPWLAPWSAKLAVQLTLDNIGRLEAIGREAFEAEAKAAAKRAREVKADVGTYTHNVVEALILSQAHVADGEPGIPLPDLPEHLAGQLVDDDLPIEDFAEMCLDGFLAFCADHDPEFLAAEMVVYDPLLKVAGKLDFAAYLRKLGIRSVVDVKTGKHLDAVQEQLSSYRRAPYCRLPMGEIAETPATDSGMVLHLRPEYPRGYRLLEVAAGDDHEAWNRFRRAVRLFHERRAVKGKPGRVLYPPLPDGSQPPTQLRDLDDEGYGRVLTPLIRAGLNTVADLADMTPAGCLAVKGIGPKSIPVIERIVSEHHTGPQTDEPHLEVA